MRGKRKFVLLISLVILSIYSSSLVLAVNFNSCTTISSAGTYTLNQSIVSPSGSGACISIASGVGNIILDGQGFTINGLGSSRTVAISATGFINENITIKNFSITNFPGGIELYNSGKDAKIIYNNFSFISGTGIYLSAVGSAVVNPNFNALNNTFTNVSTGIAQMAVGNSLFESNRFKNGNYAFTFSASGNNIYQRNTIDYQGYGFYLTATDSNWNIFTQNNISHSRNYGFYLTNGKNNTFFNNLGLDNAANIFDVAPSVFNNTYFNNIFDISNHNLVNCSEISAPGYYSLNTNLLSPTPTEGHLSCFFINSNDVYLDGKNFQLSNGTTYYGIEIAQGVRNVTIKNFNLNKIGIFGQLSTNITIANNIINQADTGISLSSVSKANISHNTFTSNVKYAIAILNSMNNIVEKNIFNNGLDYDYAEATTNGTMLVDNNFNNGGNYAIRFNVGALSNISNNTIVNYKYIPVIIQESDLINVVNNYISNLVNQSVGIFITNSSYMKILNNSVSNFFLGIDIEGNHNATTGLKNVTSNVIFGNYLKNNYVGIQIIWANNGTISNNSVFNNSYGIFIASSGRNNITYNNISYSAQYAIVVENKSCYDLFGFNVGLVNKNKISPNVSACFNIYQNNLIPPSHPADNNTLDLRIGIDEFTSYYRSFKLSLPWSTGPSPPDANYYTKARQVFKLGEVYWFNESCTTAWPGCWITTAP